MDTYLALTAIILTIVVPTVIALGKAAFGQPRAWGRIKRSGTIFLVFQCYSFTALSAGVYFGRFATGRGLEVGAVLFAALALASGFFAAVIWLFDQLTGDD